MSFSVAINGYICSRWGANKLIGNYKDTEILQNDKTMTTTMERLPQIMGETLFYQQNRQR